MDIKAEVTVIVTIGTKFKLLAHSLINKAMEFAETNPRLVFKGACKTVVASSGAAAVAFATHGWPVTGGVLGAVSAGAVALDGFMSNSQGEKKEDGNA
jgi:hypothetical protein